MKNFLLKIYLVKRASELKTELPNDYINTLHNIKNIDNNKIIFSYFISGYRNELNANSALKGYIIFSYEWAARYILISDNIIKIAFLQTVGHELTHKDGDFPILKYGVNYIKFIAYVNEVHADFGSAQKMLNSNRKQLLQSMLYKQSQFSNIDKGDYAHPSWEKRIYYVKHFNFAKTLIRQIMYDINCLNDVIIDDVSSYFGEIILH